MKIYTKTGDAGMTGLIGGQRVSKSDLRIECYGTIDELNASLGLAAVGAPEVVAIGIAPVQNELFIIGSHLAAIPGTRYADALPVLPPSSISRLENQIDEAEKSLAPLQQFILPGGSETAARLHLARTIARRAERLMVASMEQRPLPNNTLAYINRLSDWLFVYARFANKLAGVQDIPWTK